MTEPALLAKGFGGGILGNRRVAFKLCVPRVELVGAPQNQARSFSGARRLLIVLGEPMECDSLVDGSGSFCMNLSEHFLLPRPKNRVIPTDFGYSDGSRFSSAIVRKWPQRPGDPEFQFPDVERPRHNPVLDGVE